jgi:hypothetical protein
MDSSIFQGNVILLQGWVLVWVLFAL